MNFELKAGNQVAETFIGGFSNNTENHLFIILKKPFLTPIKTDIEGVKFIKINDPHYWLFEYDDSLNHQTLACKFYN